MPAIYLRCCLSCRLYFSDVALAVWVKSFFQLLRHYYLLIYVNGCVFVRSLRALQTIELKHPLSNEHSDAADETQLYFHRTQSVCVLREWTGGRVADEVEHHNYITGLWIRVNSLYFITYSIHKDTKYTWKLKEVCTHNVVSVTFRLCHNPMRFDQYQQ